MIGPPDNSRCERLAFGILDEPLAWMVCLGLGLGLTWAGRRKRWESATALGLTSALLSPLPAQIGRSWIGQFPNIDKEGSLAHYLAKVHHIWPWQGEDSAGLRRIGVHVWHLWPVEWLDLAFPTVMSFNLVLLFNVFATLYLSNVWFQHEGAKPGGAWLAALPFAFGPAMLRQLEWSTIEKSSLYWLPLYLLSLKGAESGRIGRLFAPALVATLICTQNLYWLILCGVFSLGFGVSYGLNLASSESSRRRAVRGLLALGMVALAVAPWIHWQSDLNGDPHQDVEESWRNQRAALDAVHLGDLTWARLPLTRAIEPLSFVLGLWLAFSRHKWQTVVGIVVLGTLALGPYFVQGGTQLENPIWNLTGTLIPGFWRVAKPEVFFFGAWLLILAQSAKSFKSRSVPVAALWMITWVFCAREGEWWPEPSKQLELPDPDHLHVGAADRDVPE